MTGEVADALMGGTPYMLDHQLRRGDLAAYWRNLVLCRSMGYSALRLIATHSLLPLLPISAVRQITELDVRRDHRMISWRLAPTWLPTGLRSELLRRDLEYRIGEQRRRVFRSVGQHLEHMLADPPDAPAVLPGMRQEIWRPYADRRLTELLLAVPQHLKIDLCAENAYAGSKQLTRRALKDLLPSAIQSRATKTIFNRTIVDWMGREEPMIACLLESERDAEIVQRGIVGKVEFCEQLRSLLSGEENRDFLGIISLIGIELWLRSMSRQRGKIFERHDVVMMKTLAHLHS
jgi:hypothetical protein